MKRLLYLLPMFVLTGCNGTPSQPDDSTKGGLRVHVESLHKVDKTIVDVHFVLERTEPLPSWSLRDLEPLFVKFFDSNGMLPETNEPAWMLHVDREALYGPKKKISATFAIVAPPAARQLSVELGDSGLESTRATIPTR